MSDRDPRWDESEPRLVELLREEILASPAGRITFARFMERALTEPGLGYYATSRLRPTRDGDFLTAPELHPFFGQVVGRFLTAVWERMGAPARFVLREYGAGRGTLGSTIRAGLRADGSGLAAAFRHEPIDLGHPTGERRPLGAVVANEFLDALPVHRVVARDGQLLERHVTWRDGWFADQDGPLSDPALATALTISGIRLADGAVAEVRPLAGTWVSNVATAIEQGVLLVIDYGHEAAELYGARRREGTLLGYRDHRVEPDPYRAVGRMDLTAHVDVSALRLAARDAGLDELGSTDLARFVTSLGLGELLSELGRTPGTSAEDYLLARSSVARLLDPRHLGAFRVLCWGRGIEAEPVLPGFEPLTVDG